MVINDIYSLQTYILFWARLLKYCIVRHIVPTALLKINFNFLEFSTNRELSTNSLKMLHSSYAIIINNILEDLLNVYKLKKYITIKHNYDLIYFASNNSLLKINSIIDYLYMKKLNDLITDEQYIALKNNLFENFCLLHGTHLPGNILELNVLAFYDKIIDSYDSTDRKRRTHSPIIKDYHIMNSPRFLEKLIKYFDTISRIYNIEESERNDAHTEEGDTNE